MPGINGHNTHKAKQAKNPEGQSGMTSTATAVGNTGVFWKQRSDLSVLGGCLLGKMRLEEEAQCSRFKKSLMKQGKHEVTWGRKVNSWYQRNFLSASLCFQPVPKSRSRARQSLGIIHTKANGNSNR